MPRKAELALLFAFLMHHLPKSLKHKISTGWQSALLIPIILLVIWSAFSLSYPVEVWLFDGNMPNWLTNTLGVDFDQRNALIVGIAMGLAVIKSVTVISKTLSPPALAIQ